MSELPITPKKPILSETEQTLYEENKRLREAAECLKTIMNKRSNTEQLSLKGSVESVLDERDKAERNIYLLKQELKRLNTLLSNKETQKEGKDFLSNLLTKFDKLY